MCKFIGKIKQIIPFKGEIEKIDSFVGEFIKNYKSPVYDNELPIDWNTVEIANAGNKVYPYAPANKVKISSLVPTIEELEWMKIIRSSGGSEYELIFDSSGTNTEGYNVATFKNTAYNIAEYFTIVPKGENIPHGLYWYTNNFSANDVTENGWNYSLYLPVAYDDEFPLEWNSLEVSKLANAKVANMVKISNLTPTLEEMEHTVLAVGDKVFTYEKGVLNNLGATCMYINGYDRIHIDIDANTDSALVPYETGMYVYDVYEESGTIADCTLSIVEQPDIPDTPTQYLYGHIAPSTVSYNGVVLPDIESVWDKETYPYAVVANTGDGIGLMLLPIQPVYLLGNIYVTETVNVSVCILTDSEWVSYGQMEWTNNDVLFYTGDFIWTSHDIYTNDGTELMHSASDPVKSYPDADVIIDGVGYVGAVLPALPEWDKTAYPYAVIGVANGATYLVAINYESSVVTADGMMAVRSGSTSFYPYVLTDNSWVATKSGFSFYPFWSNYDVKYNAALETVGGTLYLSATEPVPVYE